MTAPAICVRAADTLAHAARVMAQRQVKRLPVVDAHGRLVGVVSRGDLLKVFLRPDAEPRDPPPRRHPGAGRSGRRGQRSSAARRVMPCRERSRRSSHTLIRVIETGPPRMSAARTPNGTPS
ncbi:hypothetical protein SRB5_47120 [Streptomyces sp. RB5]|uniref:CBS domain-containing protein n=1 Tax=Streptomyces smaragdinus TaxID=2585196 RepID=A0A7K0CP65_9ACTN|nr:hypothetical protein [Streptomyces smaragdinus]